MERIEQLRETIRVLCGRVLIAEGAELDRLMVQLRQALREHFIENNELKSHSEMARANAKS